LGEQAIKIFLGFADMWLTTAARSTRNRSRRSSLAIASAAAAALLPLNNSAFEFVRTFAVALIARSCAMSLAGNLTFGIEAALADLATLDGCFILCLRGRWLAGFRFRHQDSSRKASC
jgi:hypothetical protein